MGSWQYMYHFLAEGCKTVITINLRDQQQATGANCGWLASVANVRTTVGAESLGSQSGAASLPAAAPSGPGLPHVSRPFTAALSPSELRRFDV